MVTPQILHWVGETVKAHLGHGIGRVLEVGSYDVNGSPRSLFAGASEYVGIDQQPGPSVDRVIPGREVDQHWPAGYFDVVLCLETLEHDPTFWLTLVAMRRVLRIGGLLLISTPTFGFPEHRYPIDCYRFGVDAYRQVLFGGMELLSICEVRDFTSAPGICAAGRKIHG